MKRVIINVTGRCDDVKAVYSCSKVIEIEIPEGTLRGRLQSCLPLRFRQFF